MLNKLTINQSLWRKNIETIKEKLSPSTNIMAIVKANAYGLGAVEYCQVAIKCGINYVAIASIEEAIELRKNKITCTILLLSEPSIDQIPTLIEYKIMPTVYTEAFVQALNTYCYEHNRKPYPIHIKIDTGLNRVGHAAVTAVRFIKKVITMNHIYVDGLYTHFSQGDIPNSPYCIKQIKTFKDIIAKLEAVKIFIPMIHAANSDSITNYPEAEFNMVRIGKRLYENTYQLKSFIKSIKEILPGEYVGYGTNYQCIEQTKIAVVGIGYADGIPSTINTDGHVIINKKDYKIIGKICMDMFMVDIQNDPVSESDDVLIICPETHPAISPEQVSEITGHNVRELTCNIGTRVKKEYIN